VDALPHRFIVDARTSPTDDAARVWVTLNVMRDALRRSRHARAASTRITNSAAPWRSQGNTEK